MQLSRILHDHDDPDDNASEGSVSLVSSMDSAIRVPEGAESQTLEEIVEAGSAASAQDPLWMRIDNLRERAMSMLDMNIVGTQVPRLPALTGLPGDPQNPYAVSLDEPDTISQI